MLEYIDAAFNETVFSRLQIQNSPSISNGSDQFGNTIVDQYLLYMLCQKLSPYRKDHRTEQVYHCLHQLFLSHGNLSKSFFEYSSSSSNRTIYPSLFVHYTNFIWNEFDLGILIDLGKFNTHDYSRVFVQSSSHFNAFFLACFLLKYRLRDIFQNVPNTKITQRQRIIGYFVEIIAIYYLATNHSQFFQESRAKEMLFPIPIK